MYDGAELPNFREALPDEAPEIARFQLALARESEGLTLDPEACARGVRAVFDDPSKGRWYAATMGRRLVASLRIAPEWSDWLDGYLWWVRGAYVLPEYRGRKIFSGLYGFVRALATIDPSVRGLRLHVDKGNEAARKISASTGMSDAQNGLFEWVKPR